MPDTQTNEDVKRRKQLLADQQQAAETRRAEAEQKADERRRAAHEADEKARAEKFEADEAKLAEARKRAEARRKEGQRRAALSPEEQTAEDQKRADMTPEERAKDDEEKGVSPVPEQQDEINALAGTPQYPVLTESIPHATGFVLSEANGQQSRENGNFVGPVTIAVGMPVKISAPAVGLVPATYVPVASGDTVCDGLALYGSVIAASTSQYLSVLARNAEVNSKVIQWGALLAADQTAVKTALAKVGLIFR